MAQAKSDTLRVQSSLYAEFYYLNTARGEKSPLFYNHTTTDKPAVNLAMLELIASKDKWSFQSGFMLGTYSQKNLAHEPEFWRHIYQLNVQYEPNSSNQIVVGVFPSHIGLESAINRDNDCYSRSYLAENSPYYETGISWTYSPKKDISWRLLALTGWQQMAQFNPALGAQITLSRPSGLKLNSSYFVGNQGKGTRLFINNYAQFPIAKNVSATLGFDLGNESGKYWHGGLFYLTWKPIPALRLSGRVEYYSDQNALIMSESFQDHARSLSADFTLNKTFLLRSEVKNSAKFGSEFLSGIVFFLR